MKYIASTSPTIRNMITCRRPCASGWRATPWMVALPARPSPTAAPMAPPPRARPAPIRAPATAIAWFIGWFSSSLVSWLVGPLTVLFHALAGHPEVHDRQEHEDEGLERPHEKDVEE